ncbi:MAG: cytochrome c peroxidase, partial [Stellaceae bacterium]
MRPRARRVAGIGTIAALGAAALAAAAAHSPVPLQSWVVSPVASLTLARGEDPHPVRLVRPPAAPLSAMAQLGRRMFFDPSLSSSGRLGCASCHSPAHAYGPPDDIPA